MPATKIRLATEAHAPFHFAPAASVTAATAGTPTAAEITTYLGTLATPVRTTLVYYTGTATNTDPVTHLYTVDSDGLVFEFAPGRNDPQRSVSPDGQTYLEAVDGQINLIVDGNPAGNFAWDAGMGFAKWTTGGGIDPAYYQGNPTTIAQRNALVATNPATKAGYLVYVVDTGVKEWQYFDGADWSAVGGATAATFVASGPAHAGGLVPDPGALAGTSKYLREDGTFEVPPLAAKWLTLLGLAEADTNWGTFSGHTLTDAAASLKTLLQDLETKIEAVELLGDLIGSFNTFADLPAASTTNARDGAAVMSDTIGTGTAANPQYPAGLYAVNAGGTAWQLLLRSSSIIALTATQVQGRTDTNIGTVSGQLLYNREQAIKGTAANFATNDADNAIAKVWDAATLTATTNPKHYADAVALIAVDTTNLSNYSEAYLVTEKESVSFSKAATAGDYKPTTGPGYWLKSAGGLNKNGLISAAITLTKDGIYGFSGAGTSAPVNVNYQNVDLATEAYSANNGWGNFTVGMDPSSSYGATPTGKVVKIRLRTTTTSPNPTEVRLYSNNAAGTLVASSALGPMVNLGNDVKEWPLSTPLTVTAGTQMLAVVLNSVPVYTDVRGGFTLRYGTGTAAPTSTQTDRFSAIQFVVEGSAASSATSIKLPDSAAVGKNAAFIFHEVDNSASFGATLSLTTAANKINGTAGGSFAMNAASGIWLAVSDGVGGYAIKQVAGATAPLAISLHDFGQAARIAITLTGTDAHLEGGAGYSLAAAGLPDAFVCRIINTTTATGTVSLSGFAGAYVRDGSGAITDIGATLSVPGNSIYDVYSDKNGANTYLNVKPGGGAATSISVQSGAHAFNQTSTTNPSGSFAVTFPKAFANPPTVELTYQWNYNASTNGTALSPPVFVDGAPTTTGFAYRINGNRNALDRVLWTAVDALTTMQAGNTVLTPRAISGSITSQGYDGVPVPCQIVLAPDQLLDTVTATNGATITNINPLTGTFNVTVSGQATAVSHTIKTGSTFTGQQIVATRSYINANSGGANGYAMDTAIAFFDLGTTLQENDRILFHWRFNGNVNQDQTFEVVVKAGTTQRSRSGSDRTDSWGFPTPLTARCSFSSTLYTNTPTLVSTTIFRQAENRLAIPSGVVLFTARTITGTGITSTPARDNTDSAVEITGIAAGQEIATVTATNAQTPVLVDRGRGGTAKITITPNGGNPVVSYTLRTWQRTITEAGGALINGAASQTFDATVPYSNSIAIPEGKYLQALTATNATINRFMETGLFTINPTNSGDVVLTATFAAASSSEYIHVVATADQTTGLAVGNPILFSTATVNNSAGCSFSAGVFTLPANKTFRLESQITWAQGTELIFQWRNITANTLIGNAGQAQQGGRGNIASALLTTTQVTTVRLEIMVNNAISVISAASLNRGSFAFIKEIERIVYQAPDGTTVLTPRNITGSVTSTGYDTVELPYQIPLAPGLILDTVSLNGTATTNFDANTGIVRIKPSGANVAVTHTTKVGATYSGLQMVGEFNPPANTVYDTLQTVTTGIDFTRCDLIEWQFRLTSDLRTISSFVPVIIGGSTPTMEVAHGAGQLSSFIANAADAAAGILKNVDCHGVAFETVKIRGWANALNKVVVPSGTTVATAYALTINGGANGSYTGHEGIGPETFYVDLPVDQEIDEFPAVAGVNLRNRQAGMISVNRAVGAGALALTGITFRAMAPNSVYFGTWDNQAGDSAATNGGHTCVRRLARGSGITTANDSLMTLSGGIFKVRIGIVRLFGNAVWRTTALMVDGSSVESMYSGRDGGNWDGGGPLEWIVDASTVNHTVQARRVSSSGNGNASGFLAIERLVPVGAPDVVELYTPRTITGTNVLAPGARDNTVTNVAVTGIPAGSEISNPTATGAAIVLLKDSGRGGIAYLDVIPNGADSVIGYTTSVWRRTLTANLNGSPVNVNGAASVNVDATRSVAFWLALPANHNLTAAPVVTGGALLSWDSAGSGVIQPDNSGNITVTANSAQAGARSARFTSNAGVWTTFGSIQIMMAGGGSRSAQVRSVSGNIDVLMHSWTGWDATSGIRSANIGINSNEYVEPAYGFGNAGNNQFGWIHDVTNNRRFQFIMTVGAGYNGNTFFITEVT